MAPVLIILLVQVFAAAAAATMLDREILQKFPAILIFGDSLLDTGNNNFIDSLVKANHLPYGEDFPGGVPTGRFSNGKLITDMLASTLGIKDTVPPFLDPELESDELKTGVCFASAGSGYDDLTTVASQVIPVSRQPENFREYVEKLGGVVGEEEANGIINGSLVLVSSGSNDVTINFYDAPSLRTGLGIDGYHDFLLSRLQDFVKEVYDQGLRNMLIFGLPPVGCAPAQMTAKLTIGRTCLENENSDSQSYNQKLVALLPQLQESLPGSKIVYGDIYTPLYDMMTDPQKYGFEVADRGCCGTGLVEAGPLCSQLSAVCANPSEYMFFDAVHPSESAYQHLAKSLEDQALSQFS